MNRRRLHRCALWLLLPLLAVRAFIPAGFMLSTDEHGLALEFCPTQSRELVQVLATLHGHTVEHASHVAGAKGTAPDQATHRHAGGNELPVACPYALASAAIAFEVPHAASVAFGPSDERIDLVSLPTSAFGPARSDRIRGPPSYS